MECETALLIIMHCFSILLPEDLRPENKAKTSQCTIRSVQEHFAGREPFKMLQPVTSHSVKSIDTVYTAVILHEFTQ